MFESELIVLKSAYGKTPGMEFSIEPCKDPKTGRYPDCVRPVNSYGDMILSDDDIRRQSKGEIFIPVNEIIKVHNGSQFDMTDPLQKAQWECIKNSKFIAKERDEKDEFNNYAIDGYKSYVDKYKNPHGRYGTAELYIERPGKTAKIKNDLRKLIHEAEGLVLNDDLGHQIMICKLFEKRMEHANPNDVLDFLLTKAQKEPQTVIKYYKTEESAIRLLLIMALERNIIKKNNDGIYYAEIRIGSNLEAAAEFLKIEQNKALLGQMKKDTFPEYQPKTESTAEVKKTKKQ